MLQIHSWESYYLDRHGWEKIEAGPEKARQGEEEGGRKWLEPCGGADCKKVY